MPRSPSRSVALIVAFAAALPVARADDEELLASVYTENGYELRHDQRVFALFAALNVAGFQRADQARELPFPKALTHPIREKLRTALLPFHEKLRPAIDQFLDSHPSTLDAYEEAVLALGDDPDYAPADGFPTALAGLDKVLADFARNGKLAKLSRGLTADYRSEFKRLRDVADKPFADLRAAWGLKEEDAPALVVIPNPLDASSVALARRAPDGSHVLIMGLSSPDRPFDVKPALNAYAALLADEALAKAPLDGATEAVEAFKGAGLVPADTQPRRWLLDSLRAAVDAKAAGRDAAAEGDAWAKKGYPLVREFLKGLSEPDGTFPADKGPWALQVLARTDLHKAVVELVKPPEPVKGGSGKK